MIVLDQPRSDGLYGVGDGIRIQREDEEFLALHSRHEIIEEGVETLAVNFPGSDDSDTSYRRCGRQGADPFRDTSP